METPENSSTRIADLPQDAVAISHRAPGVAPSMQPPKDRGFDMAASASYQQMNMHQNPYGQETPGFLPPPSAANGQGQQGFLRSHPQQQQQEWMTDAEYLGRPTHPLQQRDIPLRMDDFRDESAMPNYVPPPPKGSAAEAGNFVEEQEDRLHAQKISEHTKRAVQDKMDWVAQMQTPILLAVLFWVFSADVINTWMARFLGPLGLFSDTGNLNFKGTMFKSGLFGACYYGIALFLNSWEDFLG